MRKLLTGGFIFGLGAWLGGTFVLAISAHALSNGYLTLDQVGLLFLWPIEAYKYLVLGG